MELFFLGCGGGRVVLDTQTMPTGGFRLSDGKLLMHCDPGPGAFLKTFSNGLSPKDLNTIFVSHCHLDHVGDAKIIIEAMTLDHWHKKFGTLLAARSVLEGIGEFEKEIPEYFKSLLLNCKAMAPGECRRLFEDAKMAATACDHEDPSSIGFIYRSKDNKTVAYTADTQVFAGLWKQYDLEGGLDAFVVNCLRPASDRFEYHLCLNEVIAGVKSMKNKPEMIIFSHFGEKFLKAGIDKEIARFEKETGIEAVAAREGLIVKV
jgi:phosphoribosyl 1,2-cyclic phosphodiesterase